MKSTEITRAFKNNFYLSEEYISFCEKITGIDREKNFSKKGAVLKNKNISIHTYTSSEKKHMKKNNIQYSSVVSEENTEGNKPSLLEYPILFYLPYEEATNRFDKTFRKYIKRAEQFNFTTAIVRTYDKKTIDEVYRLHVQHIKRLHGMLNPKSFLETYLQSPSSFFILIYHENLLVGYSCCFENKDNMYTSIGAGHKDYFDKYINYKLYHEKIKYACQNKLHIHMGQGIYGSGYNAFKIRTGAICLKNETYPNNENIIKKALFLIQYRWFGFFLRIYSRLFPKKSVFQRMPFT